MLQSWGLFLLPEITPSLSFPSLLLWQTYFPIMRTPLSHPHHSLPYLTPRMWGISLATKRQIQDISFPGIPGLVIWTFMVCSASSLICELKVKAFFCLFGFSNILEQTGIKWREHFQVVANQSKRKSRLLFNIGSRSLILEAGPL